MSRPRHPNKELEIILRIAEDRTWRVEKGSNYFKALCACREKHYKTIHLTPSDPNYGKNLLAWFRRQSCWTEA